MFLLIVNLRGGSHSAQWDVFRSSMRFRKLSHHPNIFFLKFTFNGVFHMTGKVHLSGE